MGSRPFVEKVKALLGFQAKGRNVIAAGEEYQVREGPAHYDALFKAEKGDIDHQNTYFLNINAE